MIYFNKPSLNFSYKSSEKWDTSTETKFIIKFDRNNKVNFEDEFYVLEGNECPEKFLL